MAGGMMYETAAIHEPEWTGRLARRDSVNYDRPGPSLTYSHLPTAPQGSPYNVTHGISTAAYPLSHQPPNLGQASLPPSKLPQHPAYYEQEAYPVAESSRAAKLGSSFQPQQVIQGPLLTTATLRSYDSTIPQYYPVTTHPIKESNQKRKRVPTTPQPAELSLETPKRARSQEEAAEQSVDRAHKRKRTDTSRSQSQSQSESTQRTESNSHSRSQTHLPSPPSIREESFSTPDGFPLAPADTPIAPRRQGVVVTHHDGEGRKLGLIGVAGRPEPPVDRDGGISPRTTDIPSLSTDATGLAIVSTSNVLQSEAEWLRDTSRSPRSAQTSQLRTPALTHSAMFEDTDSPNTRATKVTKRLELFKDDGKQVVEQAMVSTRIDMFGRVAVRKNLAATFLSLPATAGLVEESLEDDGNWTAVAASSKSVERPRWPDQEAPWALAGGKLREKKRKEKEQKSSLLKRYFEATSDEGSDDDGSVVSFSYNHGRGKTAQRLAPALRTPSSRTQTTQVAASDATMALKFAIRRKNITPLPKVRVACVCGASTIAVEEPFLSCSHCNSLHHLGCNGLQDGDSLPSAWWCHNCHAASIAMSTPAHSTPRAFVQSDERSSAFRGDYANIALAPSPMFGNPSFTQMAAVARTPMNRVMPSPTSRSHRPRVLSYGQDMWNPTEDGAPSSVAPSTPGPSRPDRFSTPRIDDMPFDVTSTPSRHLDFTFGQPSLFSLTPIGPRGRVPSAAMYDGTPFGGRARNIPTAVPLSEIIPSRHDFLRDLNQAPQTEVPASPQLRLPQALLGAHNVSPSPFGHRRSMSGNKLSSMRSSSKSGLGLGMTEEKDE